MKKYILAIIVLGLLIIIGYFLIVKNKLFQKIENIPSKTDSKFEDVKADLNGDGKQETLRLAADDKGPYLVALGINGKEIGPHSLPLPTRPFSNSGKAILSDSETKQQFVSFDFVVGPHSSSTMFFGLQQYTNAISLVCHKEEKTDPESCFFWSGDFGELITRDLDNDGALEVVETVDEYPRDGSITADIEKMINEQFGDAGQDAANGMIRIAKREQGGRGNKVIWGVYRFNGNFFEEQTGANYDKYFALLIKIQPDLMKKNDLSKGSLEYNEFMKRFWTRR